MFFVFVLFVRVSRAQRVNKSLDFSAISVLALLLMCVPSLAVCVQTLTVYMAAKFQEFSQQNCQRNYINIAGGGMWGKVRLGESQKAKGKAKRAPDYGGKAGKAAATSGKMSAFNFRNFD